MDKEHPQKLFLPVSALVFALLLPPLGLLLGILGTCKSTNASKQEVMSVTAIILSGIVWFVIYCLK